MSIFIAIYQHIMQHVTNIKNLQCACFYSLQFKNKYYILPQNQSNKELK